MKYLLLIYQSESVLAAMPDDERNAHLQSYFIFNEAAAAKTKMLGGEGLYPTASATCVRQRDGKTLTTDGPYAETKEQLGGYYLIDAEDLDEAIEVAAMIPDAKLGTIEIRPIMTYDLDGKN